MVTFTTDMYAKHFEASMRAKELYAQHWGYNWDVFDENTLACSDFREHRWRGDYRYCKLQAIKVVWQRIAEARKRSRGKKDYIFWHDVDTHIMRPEIPLESFIEAGSDASLIFTDNALSLNNGVFFLQVSKFGGQFFKKWRTVCKKGEWPWADNGCMYEAMLQFIGTERYKGACTIYNEKEFNEQRPEPPTGTELMGCFNEEMKKLGVGCCGKARKINGFAFLTGETDSFNHHPCDELLKAKHFENEDRAEIRAHCYYDGMFMAHTKDSKYSKDSLKRVQKITGGNTEL